MSLFSNSSYSHSILDNTIQELQQQQQKHTQVLQNVIQQYSKKLQNLQFQQNHLQQRLVDIQNNHQQRYLKYMKEQEKLIAAIQEKSKYVTLGDLRAALRKQGNWGKAVGYFLNPLAAFNAYITKLQMDYSDHYNTLSEFSNSQSVCKQVLMKHSEKKLMTLQKMVELEEEIMSLDERYRMTVEDVQGRSEQICGLIFEYEDLEQLSQQMDQSLINSHQGALLSKKGLIETQKKYQILGNQRTLKEKQLASLRAQSDAARERLRLMKIEQDSLPCEQRINVKTHESTLIQHLLSSQWLHTLMVGEMKAIQGNKAVIVAEAYFNVVVEVQALVLKILELIEAGEKKAYEIEVIMSQLCQVLTKNQVFLNSYQKLNGLLLNFKEPSIYATLTTMQQKSPTIYGRLLQAAQQLAAGFRKRFTLKKNQMLQSLDLEAISKTQVMLEKELQQVVYNQSMAQHAFSQFQKQLNEQLFINDTIKPSPECEQIIMLVERMSILEQRRIDSQHIIEQHRESLQLLLNNKSLVQVHLKEQVSDLFTLIEIETSQLLKIQHSLNFYFKDAIPQFEYPQLILNKPRSDPRDLQYYEKEAEENRTEWNQFEHEQLKIMQELEEELNIIDSESSMLPQSAQDQVREKIMKTQQVLKDTKGQGYLCPLEQPDASFVANLSIWQANPPSELLQLIAPAGVDNKENLTVYNQLHQRSQSVMFSSNQDSSILGAISIDISSSILQRNSKHSNAEKKQQPLAERSNNRNNKPGWNTSTKTFKKQRKASGQQQNENRKNITPIRQAPSSGVTPLRVLDNKHNRSQSSISHKQALSPPQKGVKKTKLTLVNPLLNQLVTAVPQQISRISQKNPVSSPIHSSNSSKVIFGFYESYRSQNNKQQDSQQLDSIENSLARVIQQETQSLDQSQNIDPLRVTEKEKMMFFSFKSPTSTNEKTPNESEISLIRVYKRQSNSTRRPSITGPPESCNFYPRYLRINSQAKCIEFLKKSISSSEKKYVQDATYLKSQVTSISKFGQTKTFPAYHIMMIALDKNVRLELLFRNECDMDTVNQFLE